MSGQVGSRSDGSPEPDFEAQVRLAFTNLEATLQAGGCGLDDIVDVTTFHTDPKNQFGTIMTVNSEVFPQAPYPNWTAIGVNWLAGFDFEIKSSPVFPADITRLEFETAAETSGSLGTQFLLERISGKAGGGCRRIVLQTNLIVQRSCGSPAFGQSAWL